MTDQKTLEVLKRIIKKQIAEAQETFEQPKPQGMSAPETVALLVKTGTAALKDVSKLKTKLESEGLPAKAREAIDSHLNALEAVLNNMWQEPIKYLDRHPDEVVADRHADLDSRAAEIVAKATGASSDSALGSSPIRDHNEAPGGRPSPSRVKEIETPGQGGGQLLSLPTSCKVCGTSYDEKVQEKCPRCEKTRKNEKDIQLASHIRKTNVVK